MNEISDDFFSGTALPSDENGDVAGGHTLDGVEDVAHLAALVDDAFAQERGGLLLQLAVFERAFDVEQEHVSGERLVQEQENA